MKNFFLLAVLFFLALGRGYAAETPAVKLEQGGNLSFTLKDADVRSILPIFAKYLKYNIVAGDDVKGRVSLSFSNISPQEGFEAVLRAKGLDWYKEGNTVVVSAKKQVRTYVLEFAPAEQVASAMNFLAEPGDSISVNAPYNALVIKASSDNMARLERAIKDFDVPPLQVMVEAKIVEVSYGDSGSSGVDVKYTRPNNANDIVQTKGFAGKASDTSAQGFYAQVLSGNVEAYLSALEATVGYNLVAAPRLCAINHKEASILIGSKIGYKTSIITITGTVQQIHFLETGTNLVFTPHISENGYIRMAIAPKISESTSITSASNDDVLPSENTTQTNSEVLVKDGQTIVIGGLIKKSEKTTDTGVPLLMAIPFLGAMFRNTVTLAEERELMIFITPHIMTPEYLEELNDQAKKILTREKREGAPLIH